MLAARVNWTGLVLVPLVIGLLGGAGGAWLYDRYRPTPLSSAALAAESPPPTATVSPEYAESAIVKTVARAAPAVVTITAISRIPEAGFFGIPFFDQPRARQSLGSGFFFDYEGRKLILTNTHVIAGATELTVRMTNGEEFAARKLGASPADVAVIEPVRGPANPPVLPLGDSDKIPVGAWVIAVGSPFGFDNTVTVGVVSRKGYTRIGPNQSRYLIQTDAAINEGNSGGPLLDLSGHVVGINEMIFSPTQTNLGIGWAIPVNEVKELMYFLINRGPWIGVTTTPNSRGLARYFSLGTSEGMLVVQVVPNSPAARAGLQPGDVILQVDSVNIKTAEQFTRAILAHKIGESIQLGIQRGSERLTLQVEAGKVPEGMY